MPAKKYRIKLTTEEQQELKALVSRGRVAAYKQTRVTTRARILLLLRQPRAHRVTAQLRWPGQCVGR